eukprot:scaffold71629_cov22-Tisochrysis_lutea.AAC.1
MQIPQRDCVGSCSSEGGSGGVEVRALVGTPAAGMKEGTQARSRKNRSRPGSLEIRRCRGLGLIGTPAAEGRRGHCLGTGKQCFFLSNHFVITPLSNHPWVSQTFKACLGGAGPEASQRKRWGGQF